jgi:hypothetical protein
VSGLKRIIREKIVGMKSKMRGKESRFRPGLESCEDRIVPDSAPLITLNPTNTAVQLGTNAEFTAAATGDPTPTVEWAVSTDGGQTFSPLTPGGIYSESTDPATLTIAAPPESMSGYEYEAVYSNGVGSPVPTTEATLTVGVGPSIILNPSNSIMNVGGVATFHVVDSPSTFPAASVQWYVNENSGNGFTAITNGGIYSGATTETLSVSPVSAALNDYEYEAVFSNVFGNATTTPATLSVLGLVATEGPHVLLYDTSSNLIETLTPFSSSMTSVQAAVGYVDSGGPNASLIVGAGPGGGEIEVYNGLNGPVTNTITPYGATYKGGLNFALGNVLQTNSPLEDIVVAPDISGWGIQVWGGNQGYPQELTHFVPYPVLFPDATYAGGLHVAVANLSGNGKDTIIVGTNAPEPAYVAEWNIVVPSILNGEYPINPQFVVGPVYAYRGEGAYVSAITLSSGKTDLVVGTDSYSGTSTLTIQNPATGAVIAQLPSSGLSIFDFGNSGQVRVGVMDVNGDGVPDIVVATGPGDTQEVRVFDLNGNTLDLIETLSASELHLPAGYTSGIYVGQD